MHDVVIIGGGPAGFTSALYCARAGLDTVLIEKMVSGGQMAMTYSMENYPGFEEPVNGFDLAARMENQAKKFGAGIVIDDAVELTLDTVIKTIKTVNNLYQSKTVILCMGASPKKLGLPDENRLIGAGVSYCATCDGAFFKDRVVAIAGGGNTAAEDALYLTRFCSKIYIIHRRDSLRASSVLQNALNGNSKVEFVWNSVVKGIHGKNEVEDITVKNIKSDKTTDIKVDGLFVAIGTTPNTSLVRGKVELNEAGYIITDENMQTNIFGAYAAGDVREKVLRQVVTAASDGAIAAYMAERYINENSW